MVVNLIRRYAIVIVIVAVVAVVGFIFRDRLSGGAEDLGVGDCFDIPTTQTVGDVQHHPCTEAHTAEVFAEFNHPAGRNDPIPDAASLEKFGGDGCTAPFESYVGTSVDKTTLDFSFLRPTDEGWGKGDREFTCYLIKPDGSTMTQSMKGSKQ